MRDYAIMARPKSNGHCATNLPISSRNSVLAVAGSCRMDSNGATLVVISGLAMKRVVITFRSQLANVFGAFSTNAQIVPVSSHGCAELNVRLHAWRVAAPTMVENLMPDSACSV